MPNFVDKWNGISIKNKKIIEDYINYRKNIGKGKGTIQNDDQALRKLAHYANNKSILDKNLDMKGFFNNPKYIPSQETAQPLFSAINKFDQYQFNLLPRERSERLRWYRKQTNQQKNKNKNREEEIKDKFITPEEYESLLNSCTRIQSKAMWETFYLSGARPDEILSMTVDSLIESKKGWEIRIKRSKTAPRNIVLFGIPTNLIKWSEQHPFKDNQNSPLWFSETNVNYGEPYKNTSAISARLKYDINRANRKGIKIRDTTTPKCFRATRATLMIGARTKDGGIMYSDPEIALYFGWSLKEIFARKQDYDLTPYEDLKNRIFSQIQKPKSKEELEIENKMLSLNIENDNFKIKEELEIVKSKLEHARQFSEDMKNDRDVIIKLKDEYEKRFKVIGEKLNINLNPETRKTKSQIDFIESLTPTLYKLSKGKDATPEQINNIKEVFRKVVPQVLQDVNKLPKTDDKLDPDIVSEIIQSNINTDDNLKKVNPVEYLKKKKQTK